MREQWFTRATELDPIGPTVREVDWASTSWGPPEDWAPGLRSAVEICLSTRFPVLVTWGPDLLMLYNEGYRAMLGREKQAGATGRPVAQVWSEVWPDISPLFGQVLSTGVPVYLEDTPLRVNRSGYDEDAWFTFCYSALRDESGQVQGVLDIAYETTEQVVARRRLSFVSMLSTQLHAATGDVDALGRVVSDVLGRSLDLHAAELSLLVDERFIPLARANPREVPLLDPSTVPELVRSHRAQVVGDTFVMPLTGSATDPVVGVLALRATAGRAPDGLQLDFMELVGVTIASALSTSVKHMSEVGE
ncbi:PAS domain-containing protein, partial [Longivirga aurantiaca]